MNTLQNIIYTFKLLLRNWWRIGLVCAVVGALSAVYIVSLPRSYKSEVIMIPEMNSGSSPGGGLSGLAKQMAGINIGNGSQDAIYPEFYPKVLGTPEFLCALLQQRVTPTGSRRSMTLFEYLTKHQESAWWSKFFAKSEEEVARKEGILAGSSSGAALAAALKLANEIEHGNIVTVFPDRGDRYFSTGIF